MNDISSTVGLMRREIRTQRRTRGQPAQTINRCAAIDQPAHLVSMRLTTNSASNKLDLPT